ncbi:uncharacterized protein PV09_01803 [Verruconis gallopava]|uniref:RAVE subunit 2/Rogdi n=1 Tax=Verruconis gallopava TaxID=253628 RepID=A0A0D1XYM2_9PEZI|nr:uncharacterized protein PV09_01803 [Verruconis gallopava]KIW07891.1 hypothetical protein PV09_01803 [Verruconis gallopava]
MATAVWPAVSPADLQLEQDRALANELEWLLDALQESLAALKAGFEECASLLAPVEPGSTLPLSSHRSESLKGVVTRAGARIVKGDIKVRLATLPPPKGLPAYPLVISSAAHAPTLVLAQLTDARSRINACLDVVDAAVWAGDAKDPHFIAGQLRLLDVNLQEAKAALKGPSSKPWFADPVDPAVFDPPLPPSLSFHMSVVDAALTVELRTLEPAAASGGPAADLHASFFRGRLAQALGAARPHTHDEIDEVFVYRGEQVKVREKVRVESSDPNLMAAAAKLTALERSVAHARKALDVVMGKDDS